MTDDFEIRDVTVDENGIPTVHMFINKPLDKVTMTVNILPNEQ